MADAADAADHGSAPAAPPRLRAQPARLVEREIERAFQVRGLFDATWNPEGDFPNQFRTQSPGLWDVVVDLESRLTWQQSGSGDRMSRADADGYIAELNRARHAGFDDWRLPTLEELASLLEGVPLSNSLYIHPSFDPEQETCWSADTERQEGLPYYVSFNVGRAVLAYGDRQAFVRAVRSHPVH